MTSKISKDEEARTAIAEQAGDWFVANDAGALDALKSAQLVEWLKASPVHVEEFLGVSTVARDLREAGADAAESVDALVARARADIDKPVEFFWPRERATVRDTPSRRWQVAAVTVAACGAAGLGWFLLRHPQPVAEVAAPGGSTALHFETRHGEQQTYRLADDSLLHLNTDTAVTIRYSKTERLAILTAGQADFEVAHELQRAFRVFAGPAEVVDLGTNFDVRLEPDAAVVTVVEGRVAVGLSPMSGTRGPTAGQRPASGFVQLGASQQISVTEGNWPAQPHAVDAEGATSWLHRQIAFDHEPLERVAAEINRYAPKPIEIATPALRDLEISGVFSTDNTEAFIAFLRSLPGVRVEETATHFRVSQQ
jgi:transmembrane sensor